MFLARHCVDFGFEQPQCSNDVFAGFARLNHIVDETVLGGDEWIRETVLEFFDLLLAHGVGVGRCSNLAAIDDVDCALGTHHGNLGGGPCEIHVASQVFRSHDAVGTPVGFARDDCDFRDGRFGECIEQLRAVADDASPLLAGTGKEAGDVFEGQDRDVEGVSEAHEAGGL